jgi:hypothetical protein
LQNSGLHFVIQVDFELSCLISIKIPKCAPTTSIQQFTVQFVNLLFRKKPSSEFSFIIASKVTINYLPDRVSKRHQHKLQE